MRVSKKYKRELKKQFNYLATWFPGTPLALGDIVVLRKGEIRVISNLKEKKINFGIKADETKIDIEYSSKGSVSVTTKASGIAALEGSELGKVDAGAVIEFSKEKAIYFKVNGATSPRIKDQPKVGMEILKLYKQGKWNKDWMVVTEVLDTDSATILISNTAKAKGVLKAQAAIGGRLIDTADVGFDFELVFDKGLETKIVAKEGLTPLFKASKVKGRLLKHIFKPFQFKAMEMSANGVGYMDLITPDLAKENEEIVYWADVNFEDSEEEDE